jgi:hypothetical protein
MFFNFLNNFTVFYVLFLLTFLIINQKRYHFPFSLTVLQICIVSFYTTF